MRTTQTSQRRYRDRLRHLLSASLMAATLGLPVLSGAAALSAAPALAADQPTRGGTMNIIVQPEPPILQLGLNQQGPTQTVGGKIYQGLLTYDKQLKPLPSLAESWDISPDGLTYTFHLHKNVKWHDGQPFTAKDVIFTTTKFLPEVHSRARANFARCESITAPDDYTVVFKLKEPFPSFINAFEVASAPIIPAHLYEANTDYKNNPANATPIGTGPFKFKEWVKGSYIHLVRNDDYYKPGLPYLDDIYFRVIPDAASRALALESGQVDQSQYNDIEPFDVARLKSQPNLNFTTDGYEFVAPVSWLELNNRNAPLNDKRFRQALMYSLDRQFIRDKIWFGLGQVATSPINSHTNNFEPNLPKYTKDVAKAKALLDEMGLKPDANGVRARIRFLVMPYGETWQRLAEYVKVSLKQVGVEVTLENTDVAGWVQKVSNWDYDMTANFTYQYGDAALGVSRTYVSSNIRQGVMFSNTMGYSNPKVDELFASAAKENDPVKRQALYSEVQRILVDDVPVAWLLEMQFPTFVSKKFNNVITTGIGVNESYESVYMTKR
ncbi:ABC transporter substrate-binding protein [Insolitispirillum peregrinum]|uniref:ABC transporter substrate-binding protein n=1 Tax=Insolitispirillum peregrinum TaxID=80876 RepID=UPI0036185E7C